MRGVAPNVAVYLWQGAVDTRMSFDRLSTLVSEKLGRSVLSGGLYLFFSRCRSRVSCCTGTLMATPSGISGLKLESTE